MTDKSGKILMAILIMFACAAFFVLFWNATAHSSPLEVGRYQISCASVGFCNVGGLKAQCYKIDTANGSVTKVVN